MRGRAVRPISASRWAEPATLIQQTPGDDNQYGEWMSGEEVSTPLRLVSAPPSMAIRRDVLPEGARLTDWRTFWLEPAAKPLRVGAGQTDGDVIVYEGLRYRLRHVNDWTPDGCIEALGVREEGQDG